MRCIYPLHVAHMLSHFIQAIQVVWVLHQISHRAIQQLDVDVAPITSKGSKAPMVEVDALQVTHHNLLPVEAIGHMFLMAK